MTTRRGLLGALLGIPLLNKLPIPKPAPIVIPPLTDIASLLGAQAALHIDQQCFAYMRGLDLERLQTSFKFNSFSKSESLPKATGDTVNFYRYKIQDKNGQS